MSADRYEITDDGKCITITEPDGFAIRFYDDSGDYSRAVLAAAIRQQSRDIESLRERLASPAHAHLDGEHMSGAVDGCVLCSVKAERDQLRAELAAAVARLEGFPSLDAMRECMIARADENADLRAELAAATAERDEARTAYQVRNTEWHRHELVALALAERYKLRAEQAEARLVAIDAAPTVAKVCLSVMQGRYYVAEEVDASELPRLGTELIARPSKD